MLAAHREDQENRLSHLAGPSKQQLAKTPGARYPKTPLKVPLNDENANNGFGGGKSVLRTKGNNENITTVGKTGKLSVVTPAATQTARAPLGNKTTNAKARTGQQTGGAKATVRQFEKSAVKPTVRPKPSVPQIESSKLEIHTDKNPLEEEEIEYAPPKPKELPYESDIVPQGTLTFEGLKPENRFRGYYQHYFNHIDDNGTSETERQMEQQRQREFQRGDEQILKDMEEFDWSVGDVPASKNAFKKDGGAVIEVHSDRKTAGRPFTKPPSTIASRKAASILAMPTKPTAISQTQILNKQQPARKTALPLIGSRRPATKSAIVPTRDSSQERATALAASRTTLGYSKGRSALSVVRQKKESALNTAVPASKSTNSVTISTPRSESPLAPAPRVLMRSVSTASSGSESTITPARFAKTQDSKDWKKLEFLSIFDHEEDDEGGFGGNTTPHFTDDVDDDFQLSTDF
ncbi:hypothetical protein V8F20_000563 [Naviculisporaceae sp. PSN 640]